METVLKTVGAVATPSPGVRIPRPPHQHKQGLGQGKHLYAVAVFGVRTCPLLTVVSHWIGHAKGTMGHAGGTATCCNRSTSRLALAAGHDRMAGWALVTDFVPST